MDSARQLSRCVCALSAMMLIIAHALVDHPAIPFRSAPGTDAARAYGMSDSCCATGGVSAHHRLVRIPKFAPPAPTTPAPKRDEAAHDAPPGMVWIPGGTFTMGSTDPLARPDEAPVHRVKVDDFWMDETEVTNAQFAKFIDATGYTTVAERPVDWEEIRKQVPPGTPRPPEELLQPGSLVFTPPDHPVDRRDVSQWWTWTVGANWRHPEGPGSSIEGRDNHPVVHIAWEDAVAYATWAGKRLPTEAEWEFAARGGLDHAVNVWGDEPYDSGRGNIWTGSFPHDNTKEDGFARSAPVKSFPPNGYGLYDTAGNVWEWCADLYRPDTYALRVRALGPDGVAVNPVGPASARDDRHPYEAALRVQRGGSFLCHDAYCASYRPSARMPGPPDSGAAHIGFRCAKSAGRHE